MTAYDSFTFTHDGRAFVAELHHDSDHGAPWEEHDGHGVVSNWARRDKRPGEMVLCQDRGSKRFYHFAESTAIAKRDGWGLAPAELDKLATKLQRKPTRGEIIRAAVLADFEHLRGWCNDDWHWCGVVVRLADGDEDDTESLWGIESNAESYIRDDVAPELAAELLARVVKTEHDEAATIDAALLAVAAAAAGVRLSA